MTVESGLRLRTAPTTASDTVAIEPPGADLLVIEPTDVATPKIGVYDQWIKVRDGGGREGYVAAWYVEKGITVPPVEDEGETGGTTETEPTPEPEAGPGESEAPVPSDSEVEPTPEPVPEPEPQLEPTALSVYVSQSAGEAGLRLRKTASLGGALVAIEKAGTALIVLEPEAQARPKIGVSGKWIHVSDPKQLQGYVAANYVGLEAEPAPSESSEGEVEAPVETPEPVVPAGTVYVSSAARAGLRMRSEPNTNSSTLLILPAGSELKVLEGTAKMIGVYGKWLKVRETGGAEGYVAAWYLRK